MLRSLDNVKIQVKGPFMVSATLTPPNDLSRLLNGRFLAPTLHHGVTVSDVLCLLVFGTGNKSLLSCTCGENFDRTSTIRCFDKFIENRVRLPTTGSRTTSVKESNLRPVLAPAAIKPFFRMLMAD